MMTEATAKTWKTRVQAAVKRGRFLKSEAKLSSSWTSCAVGEHRGKYRADDIGYPAADRLVTLGMDFYSRVNCDDVDGAQTVFDKIEAYFVAQAKRKATRKANATA